MMEDLNYPNARDCQHGQLRRSCPHCEYERDMQEAHEKIGQLQRQNDELSEHFAKLKAYAYLTYQELLAEGIDHPYGTPKFNLAVHDAGVVEKFVHEYERQKFGGTVGVFHFFNEWKLRQQQTNGEKT
ncbi:hypothetical protein [uncultured Methylophaga sp.]|uniref:hypothetical protein n=1 Tax=uncultured Methylophaga sp. TaxID=285271 RepID=UPI0030FC6863